MRALTHRLQWHNHFNACKIQNDGTAKKEAKFAVTVEDQQIAKSNPLASLFIEEACKDLLKVQNVYKLTVKDDNKVIEIIERWQKPY